MAFATTLAVICTVFVLLVPIAMVAVLVHAAPTRSRRTTGAAQLRARTAETVVRAQELAA